MTSPVTSTVLLTPADLAARLQAPAKTLAEWRSRGIGPRFVKVGRHVRYSQLDIDAWLAEQTRGGTNS